MHLRVFFHTEQVMKTALITGAGGGIGSETVKLFIENGYFVIGQYNTGEADIAELKKQLSDKGLSDYFVAVKADFNCDDGAEKLYRQAEMNFGHVDVLVNNAGVGLYKLITETTDAEWDKLFNVNVKSAFKLSKLCLEKMIERKRGKIVCVSSIWGVSGACMEVAYSASKSALIGFTKALAKEVAPSGINVNCVCPGVIDTKMNARFSEEEMNQIKEETPLGRLGTAKEIAELIYFLASEKSDFITGQIITADGGYIL